MLPKLRRLSGRDVVRILQAHGFTQIRQRGSHIVMQKQQENTITTIVPDHDTLRIGTLQSIIRQSQLPRSLFE